MKIAVFGASGRTGLPLVKQALERDHDVRALVRNPEKLGEYQSKLTLVEGNVIDLELVEKTVEGTDAVVNVLGHAKHSPDNILVVSTRNIITAMNNNNIKRIAFLTGAGVRVPGDEPKLFDRFIVFMLKTMQGKLLNDSVKSVDLLKNSELDWTVVRAPMLTQKPGSKSYKVGMVGKETGTKLSRQNAATFLLDVTENNQYIKQSPMISD